MGMKTRMVKKIGAMTAPVVLSRMSRSGNRAVSRAGDWAADRLMPNRRRRSPMRIAATGLGAAAVALPFGLWLGRRGRSSDEV